MNRYRVTGIIEYVEANTRKDAIKQVGEDIDTANKRKTSRVNVFGVDNLEAEKLPF